MYVPGRQKKLAYTLMAHDAGMTTTIFITNQLVISRLRRTNLIQGKDDPSPGKC